MNYLLRLGTQMSDNITCILCPLGCKIHLERKNNEYIITGNICKKGEEYSIQEIQEPLRVLTTTIYIKDGDQLLLPVRSEKGIHKDLIFSCIKKLSKINVKAPIKIHDIIYENILNTGVNIIASRDINKKIIPI